MIMNVFESLLDELGKEIGISNLAPDDTGSCLIRLKNGIEVQIEPDQKEGWLLIGTTIGEVPLGRYREDLFDAALKANGAPLPFTGVFSWSNNKDLLLLHEKLSLEKLNGSVLADSIQSLAIKAKEWKEAIDQGRIPETAQSKRRSSGGIFGLA